jgi:LysM repeat protein
MKRRFVQSVTCRFGLVLAGLAVMLPLPIAAQPHPANVQLANLRSDLDRIDQMLRATRIELESLQRENAELRALVVRQTQAMESGYVTMATLNRALADLEARLRTVVQEGRDAVVKQVAAEVENLAKQTQSALQSMARSIDAKPALQPNVTFNQDYPKTGQVYTVKSGDSLARIARDTGSRVDWIRNANRLTSDTIRPGDQLFIPLPE